MVKGSLCSIETVQSPSVVDIHCPRPCRCVDAVGLSAARQETAPGSARSSSDRKAADLAAPPNTKGAIVQTDLAAARNTYLPFGLLLLQGQFDAVPAVFGVGQDRGGQKLLRALRYSWAACLFLDGKDQAVGAQASVPTALGDA